MKENLNLNTGVVYAWEIRYFLSKLLTSNYSFQINSTGLNPRGKYWFCRLKDSLLSDIHYLSV